MVLHAGSFIERHEDGSLTNTAVVIDRDGELKAVYRKIHLFGFTDGEPKYLAAVTRSSSPRHQLGGWVWLPATTSGSPRCSVS